MPQSINSSRESSPRNEKRTSSAYGKLSKSQKRPTVKPKQSEAGPSVAGSKQSSQRKSVSYPPWKVVEEWPDTKERTRRSKHFILDGIALSSFQENYGQIQPKLGPAIPPYNSHYDKSAGNYFKNEGVDKTLRRTNQSKKASESIEGKYVDNFHEKGGKFDYLKRRNLHGSGHALELTEGHSRFMIDIKPMNGYNGKFGYRRNVPHLRKHPTLFGVKTISQSLAF